MVAPAHILGMNARVQLYTSHNTKEAKRYGFSKLRAKQFLAKHNIQVPQLYALLTSQEELRAFDWDVIDSSFAIKPASGSAGKGIIVIARKLSYDQWESVDGDTYTTNDLRLHISDILDGQYSTWGHRHMAIIEERIPIHPALDKYVQMGTPDIRVILYRRIPVMAMARFPTEVSDGRANLDQGAVGLGIDLATGKTIHAVLGKKKIINYFPHNNESVKGIKIPKWTDVLKTAVRTANATGLTYMGVDIFLHPTKGPMVVEVNTQPGLSIQLANMDGLRQRLERLEGVQPRNVAHAVKIGQSLFAESYPGTDEVGDKPIISYRELIKIRDEARQYHDIQASINTARHTSAIAESIATRYQLNDPNDLLYQQRDEEEGKLPVVQVVIKVKDRVLTTSMIVSKRLNTKQHKIELGRKDLEHFLISGGES